MFDGAVICEAGEPSLRALAFRLRHPETWPDGFTWRFAEAGRCAMGLAWQVWRPGASAPWFGGVAELFGIPARAAFALFVDPGLWSVHQLGTDPAAITPEMVADELDDYVGRFD